MTQREFESRLPGQQWYAILLKYDPSPVMTQREFESKSFGQQLFAIVKAADSSFTMDQRAFEAMTVGQQLFLLEGAAAVGGGGSVNLVEPDNIVVVADDLSFTVTWDAVPDALGYEASLDGGEWIFSPTNGFTSNGQDGEGHTVEVRAIVYGDAGISNEFELVNPVPLVVQPVYLTGRVSAIDTATDPVNGFSATHSVAVPPGFQGMVLLAFHGELDGAVSGLDWIVARDGVRARPVWVKDGYAGDVNGTYVAGNKLFRGFFINRPSEGLHDITLAGYDFFSGDLAASPNELAVTTLLINNTADIDFPFRDFDADISASNRGSETETVNSSLTDLVFHFMGHSQPNAQEGTIGTGEVFTLRANDNTGDASILVSRKTGGSGTTTVSSTGFDADFCLQGIALSIMGLGEPEFNNVVINDSGTMTSPVGNAPGQVTFNGTHWVANGSNENAMMIASPLFGNDQYSEMEFEGNEVRCLVRIQDDSALNCYALTITTNTFDIRKLIDGGSIDYTHIIGTPQTPNGNFVAHDRVGLKVTGTTTTHLDVYINGVFAYRATDSTAPYIGGQPGNARFNAGNMGTRYYATDGVVSYDS